VSMVIVNDELNALSLDIWEWRKTGRSIAEAPEEIQKKIERYKELHSQIKNAELQLNYGQKMPYSLTERRRNVLRKMRGTDP